MQSHQSSNEVLAAEVSAVVIPRHKYWALMLSAKTLLAVSAMCVMLAEFNLVQFHEAYAHWPPGKKATLTSHFATWDSAHYLVLSKGGYTAGSSSCAFYPLWPMLLRGVNLATGGSRPVLTAMVLANGLSLIGLWLLGRLMERHCGPGISRDALILLLAFPGALFFSFPYTESLYLVLLMAFFWGLELKRWGWVAAAGFLLPLTRAVGVFIVLPLAWWLYELEPKARREEISGNDSRVATSTRSRRRESALTLPGCKWSGLTSAATRLAGMLAHRRSLLLLAPLLGYATYFGLMYLWTGNAFEGFEAQKAYPYSPSIKNMFDLPAFWSAFIQVRSLGGMMDSALDRGFFLLFLALLPAVWKRNRVWFWYVLPAGLIPALTSYFMSYRRYIMVLFPLFIVLAQWLGRGPRWMFWYYVILMAALQAWAVSQFVNFFWAG